MANKRCLEFFIHIAAMMASTGALVAAILAQIKISDLSDSQLLVISTASNKLGQDKLLLKTQITVALVFSFVAILMIFGFVALAGRLYNARHDKNSIRIFTIQYILYILVCFTGLATAGILGVLTSLDWSAIQSRLDNSLIRPTVLDVVDDIFNSLVATSACSLMAALLLFLLNLVVIICCTAVKNYSNYVELTAITNDHES